MRVDEFRASEHGQRHIRRAWISPVADVRFRRVVWLTEAPPAELEFAAPVSALHFLKLMVIPAGPRLRRVPDSLPSLATTTMVTPLPLRIDSSPSPPRTAKTA